MQSEYFLSIYLDTRRQKANGKFPVKLRIFTAHPRIQKLYNTKFEFSIKEFQSIWETEKPRFEHKEIRNQIRAIELNADKVAKDIQPFSFDQFERKFLRNNGAGNDVIFQFVQYIDKLKANENIGTYLNYETALKSIKNYIKSVKGKEPTKIAFSEITPDWLQKYENYMINDLKRSRTTVSMYTRNLRTIYNISIREKEIPAEIYPFGKNKYQPPAVRNVKKAFSKVDLNQLFNAVPKTPLQARAKDFFFFTYVSNGMNLKDIALLRYENIQNDKIVFYRSKTINTAKTDLRPVIIYLTELSLRVIREYGNKNKKPKEYIFPIISDENTAFKNHRAIKDFIISLNKNLKKLAKANGLTGDISTMWARHSFATNAVRDGASLEIVGEAMSHNNLKTTQIYFAGFENSDIKELTQKLMNFDQ